jgi:short subunit dehydrogenase-like uncharacterized protein
MLNAMTRVAIYGANGFQGTLVLAELKRRGIETVLAGRSPGRLRETARGAGLPAAQIRPAALDDHVALTAALRDVDAVINCAGPFTDTADKVVRAAFAAGCHYVDTCGEPPEIHHIHETFDADARSAGVTAVPATTDGGVPGDLLAHLLWLRLGALDRVTATHRITGGTMSRGSLRSLAALAAAPERFVHYRDGGWLVGDDRPAPLGSVVFPGESAATKTVGFPLQEAVLVPRHVRVRTVDNAVEESLAALLAAPVGLDSLDLGPAGPDAEERAAQHWTIVVDAVGEDGRSARGVARGPDTYGTTAVIAVESALRLADGDAPAGVLAPAQAFDAAGFLDILAPHGVRWSVG